MRIASAAEISLYLCNRYLAFSRHLKDVSSWRFLGSVKNHCTKKFASTIRSHEFCTSSVAVVARQHIQRNKGSPVVEQSISLATNSRCRRIKGLQVAKLCENLTSCNAAGGCTSEQQVTGKQNWIPSVGSWPIAADSASYSGHSRAQFSDLGYSVEPGLIPVRTQWYALPSLCSGYRHRRTPVHRRPGRRARYERP